MQLCRQSINEENFGDLSCAALRPAGSRAEDALLVHALRHVVDVGDVRTLLRVRVDAHVHQVPQLSTQPQNSQLPVKFSPKSLSSKMSKDAWERNVDKHLKEGFWNEARVGSPRRSSVPRVAVDNHTARSSCTVNTGSSCLRRTATATLPSAIKPLV